MTKEAREALRINLKRYLLRMEGAVRRLNSSRLESSNDRSNRSSISVDDKIVAQNKIVNKPIITIFMTFLTYQPVDRRDYLKNDLSIEDAFKEEAENIEELGNLLQSFGGLEKTEKRTTLLKSPKKPTIESWQSIKSPTDGRISTSCNESFLENSSHPTLDRNTVKIASLKELI